MSKSRFPMCLHQNWLQQPGWSQPRAPAAALYIHKNYSHVHDMAGGIKMPLLKSRFLCVTAILSLTISTAFAAEEAQPDESSAAGTVAAEVGPAETGPAKAAKESTALDFLDGDTLFGGKFSTWVEFASDYVFRGESETND